MIFLFAAKFRKIFSIADPPSVSINLALPGKFALGICVVVNAVAGVVNAFSTNLFLFGLCRLLIGMAHIGAYISSYVLLIESTLPKFTNNAGAILSLAWPSGRS